MMVFIKFMIFAVYNQDVEQYKKIITTLKWVSNDFNPLFDDFTGVVTAEYRAISIIY